METELVEVGHLLRPPVNRLPGAEASGLRDLLRAAVVPDRFGLEHGAADGNACFHAMSTARTPGKPPVIHNAAMGPGPDRAQLQSESFKSRLKEAMDLKGVNANQISVAMAKLGYHLPRQTIGNMLRGRTKMPRWDKLVLISGYLGVRPEWLADGVLPMTPAPLLDDTEVELLQAFRKMSVHHQADLRDIAERWAQTDEGKPPDPSGEYDPRAPKQ